MKKIYDEEFNIIGYEPDCVEEWLELIYEIGYNFYEHDTVDELKMLVAELMDMVLKTCRCLRNGDIYSDNNAARY